MVFTLDETFDAKAKMKVIGIGGAGGNAVNRMVSAGLTGVEFISVNTDAMALDNNHAQHRLQIGERITKGLGAGANPEIGRMAMEEDRERIASMLEGADMLFITAGMGGGTGTGGAPVVAEIARELDILTVAIVTRPFLFEGKIRDRNARKGIDELRKSVDTIIVIPNQKLLTIVDRSTALMDAFKTADDVLHQATKGISDLISVHGLVNLDFADVKTIMKGMGDALMGSGIAEGEDRAVLAADSAINSPLLDEIRITGAQGILINITGGEDMTLYDVSDATQVIYDAVGEDAETNIIFGAVTDPAMNGKIMVTVIATGFNEEGLSQHRRGQEKMTFRPGMISSPSKATNHGEQMTFNLTPSPAVREEKTAAPVPARVSSPDPVVESQQDPAQEPAPAPMAIVSETADEKQFATEPVAATEDRPVLRVVKQEAMQRVEATPDRSFVERDTGSFEFPAFLKSEAKRKEEKVFVSKGRVITHYEDDMDVPTFLRKQMQ